MAASTLQDLARPANWPRMRPRFIADVTCDADQVMEAMQDVTQATALPIAGTFSDRHCVLVTSEEERQFWSPQLGITVEDARTGADGAPQPVRVLGVFSPHPEIWTSYVFAIGTLAGIGVFGTMYAIVQLSMGHPPWALLAPLLSSLVGGLIYTSTLVGQGLALGEMYRLRSHLDECLEAAEARGRTEPGTSEESAQL